MHKGGFLRSHPFQSSGQVFISTLLERKGAQGSVAKTLRVGEKREREREISRSLLPKSSSLAHCQFVPSSSATAIVSQTGSGPTSCAGPEAPPYTRAPGRLQRPVSVRASAPAPACHRFRHGPRPSPMPTESLSPLHPPSRRFYADTDSSQVSVGSGPGGPLLCRDQPVTGLLCVPSPCVLTFLSPLRAPCGFLLFRRPFVSCLKWRRNAGWLTATRGPLLDAHHVPL